MEKEIWSSAKLTRRLKCDSGKKKSFFDPPTDFYVMVRKAKTGAMKKI